MEGKKLPAFSMADQDGKTMKSSDIKGPFVLYFYPKDDTPGCTKEACAIRDNWGAFQKAGLKVYGVSADAGASHQKFRAKYDLPHTLLTADIPTLEKLGVWKEKNMYGRKYMGIVRDTFLVGKDGTVLKHYEKVKPEEHATELLADFKALG